MDGTNDFSELVAYLLVVAMASALALPFVAPVFRRWARTACASRVRTAISGALLLAFVYMGGSLDKQQSAPFTPESFFGGGQPSLRTGEPSTQPQWHVALGYPATDTDGDGIPDYWERRTHTNPAVADAGADPDGDGVDNAEEFLHQCDPVVADTDGDGLTDREEIDGAAAGLAGFDPLLRCGYAADESDAGAWSNDTDVVVFDGVSSAGYPWGVNVPDESSANVDAIVTVDTSRHAELSWDNGEWTSRLLLPPCTNLALRIVVPATAASSVTLSPAPGATGLWKSALRAQWDERRGLDIERNRVQAGNGAMVDIGNEPAVFEGVLPGTFAPTNSEPTRAEGPRRQNSHVNAPPVVTFTVRTVGTITGVTGCLVHGPDTAFSVDFWNASPPYHWIVNDRAYVTQTPTLTTLDGLVQDREMDVSCTSWDNFLRLKLTASGFFEVGRCQDGPQTNIVGAGWTSTHNPTDATDHLPYVENDVTQQPGPMCPVYTNTVVHAGWTHNTAILWIRNLIRKLTGHPEDDDTDHCISVLWTEGGSTNLWSFLDPVCLPYTNALSIRVWEEGSTSQPYHGVLTFGSEPYSRRPRVCNVILASGDGVWVYDRMWLIISSPSDSISFDDWYDIFHTNLLWTTTIPRPPSCLSITTNSSGVVSASTPTGYTSIWSSPRTFGPGDFMHHNAKYELRTETSGQHGNQATYNDFGNIITTTIAAGTADWFGPYGPLGTPDDASSHRNWDVYPYLRALQLDGNPGVGVPWFWKPSNLSRPCLRQGENLDKYLHCRPCIH